jgi:hypothetical protein
MAGRARRRSGVRNDDAVRIVPLRFPKPVRAIEDLTAGRARRTPADPFAGAFRSPPRARLTYRSGPLIRNARVFTVYWGAPWQSSPTARQLRAGLDRFLRDILISSLIDQLDEYSVRGQAIGHGRYLGSQVISASAPVGSVSDGTLRRELQKWIRSGAVPKNTADSLYFVFLAPGVVSAMGGSRSCQAFCGYHNAAGSIYYAVVPYPSCAGCLGNMSVLDALTATCSHELCEAITDPVPGTGWYDDHHGEIGDICAWNFRKVGPHAVQREWSNARRKCESLARSNYFRAREPGLNDAFPRRRRRDPAPIALPARRRVCRASPHIRGDIRDGVHVCPAGIWRS